MKNRPVFVSCFIIFSSVLLLDGATPAFAQPTSGGPQPGTAPTDTPIDGGVSLLVAAGVGFGLKRLKRRRQSSDSVEL